MTVNEYIIQLEELIAELKTHDQSLPIEMRVTMPHRCCGRSRNDDDRCYCDGDEFEFSQLTINKETEYDNKSKKRVLKKLWVRGEC